VRCEFHGGPLAGQTHDIPEPLPRVICAPVPLHLQVQWWADPPAVTEPMPEPIYYHRGRLRSGGYAYTCNPADLAQIFAPAREPDPGAISADSARHQPGDPPW